MSVKNFENKRWGEGDQEFVFRHAKALEMIEKGEKILDIGCGDGLLLSALAKNGVTGFGVDVSEEGARKCREKGLDVSVVDISAGKLPFKDDSFDTVVMLDVLEHVYAPEELLKEAVRVSKKYVIVSVPNFNSLPARFQVLFGKVPENNRPNKGHLYWFNERVLMQMCGAENLRLVRMEVNTFWEHHLILGSITRLLIKFWPSMFGLSFVIKFEKNI